MSKRFQYFVTSRADLPQGATSPVMNNDQMEQWLETMDERGFDFVSYAETRWHDAPTQSWWIFRKPLSKPKGRKR